MSAKKRSTQRKQGHKDKKCERGKPLYYEELKGRLSLSLTPTAKQSLEDMAAQEKCSISELLERWVRGRLRVSPQATTVGEASGLGNVSANLPPLDVPQSAFVEQITALKEQVAALVQVLHQKVISPVSNEVGSSSIAIPPESQ